MRNLSPLSKLSSAGWFVTSFTSAECERWELQVNMMSKKYVSERLSRCPGLENVSNDSVVVSRWNIHYLLNRPNTDLPCSSLKSWKSQFLVLILGPDIQSNETMSPRVHVLLLFRPLLGVLLPPGSPPAVAVFSLPSIARLTASALLRNFHCCSF